MIKPINNNKYFKFFQPKLFYINNDIDNDDPVRLLSAILEEMDFSNLLQVFPNKTIETIDYNDVALTGGILNCTTWVIRE